MDVTSKKTSIYDKELLGRESYNSIAVIIPTYNRWDCLQVTLQALLEQVCAPDEVIVVDDGSTDATRYNLQKWERRHKCPFRFKILTQENSGPAKARNLGVKHSNSDLVAFLGDDTIPAPDWVRLHLEKQNELGGGHAVAGYTEWDAETVRITPFLKYINGRGAQFKYDLMTDGEEAAFSCFYTSNISIPRKYLIEEPFNEIFRLAGWEDAEVGYRLSLRGIRIVYHKAAQTRHRHKTTVASFMRRQYTVGSICPEIIKLHPELESIFSFKDSLLLRSYIVLGYVCYPFIYIVRLFDYWRIPLPRTVYLFFLGWYYVRGLRNATNISHKSKNGS